MRFVFLLTVGLALASPSAWAQRGSKSPSALVKEGERLYKAGKYREAAEVLKKAQDAQPTPIVLYNIGRAYQRSGELREALSYYQQYVGLPADEADPELLKKSAIAIDEIRVLLEKEEKTAAAAATERKRLEDEAEASRKKAEEEQAATKRAEEAVKQQQAAEQKREAMAYRRSRLIAFGLGGVAAASAGAGIFFGLQARDARQEFDKATNVETKQTAADDTRSKSLLADIGFGVGIAAAIGAIIAYPKEGPPAEGDVRLTLAPRGAGAGVEVSF